MATSITQPDVLNTDSLYVTDTGELHGLQIVSLDVYGNEIYVTHVVKNNDKR